VEIATSVPARDGMPMVTGVTARAYTESRTGLGSRIVGQGLRSSYAQASGPTAIDRPPA